MSRLLMCAGIPFAEPVVSPPNKNRRSVRPRQSRRRLLASP